MNDLDQFTFVQATTDVSWATIVRGPDNLMVTCHFITGSKAKGCLIKIRSSEEDEVLHIPRHLNSHLTSRCIKYKYYPQTVIVNDWKIDGTTGSQSVKAFTSERQESPCKHLYPHDSHRHTHTYICVHVCMHTYILHTHNIIFCVAGFDLESKWKSNM